MRKLFPVGLVALVASLALLGATVARAGGPPVRGGCGNGFTLTYNPDFEAQLAAQKQGHVNGDGWVCVQNNAQPHPAGTEIAVDNNVPLQAQG